AGEASDDHGLLILDDDGRLRGALVDGHRPEITLGRAGGGELLLDVHAHLIAVVDLRGDREADADVLARRLEAQAEPPGEPGEPGEPRRTLLPLTGEARELRQSSPHVGLEGDVLPDG